MKQTLYPMLANFIGGHQFLPPHLAAPWYTRLIRLVLEYCTSVSFCTDLSSIIELKKTENSSLKVIDFDAHQYETREWHQVAPLT